jgi:hypothetical protein
VATTDERRSSSTAVRSKIAAQERAGVDGEPVSFFPIPDGAHVLRPFLRGKIPEAVFSIERSVPGHVAERRER